MNQKDTKIVSYKGYIAGWLDSSIQEFLEDSLPKSESMKYALITCLDSNLDPAPLLDESPHLKSVRAEARPLKNGLLLPTKRLLEIHLYNKIFVGFDEVWFFPSETIEPKPDSTWLVGPARIDQKTLSTLGPWLLANACSMALGDGEGLNFIVKAAGPVRYLLGHSIHQPSPSLQHDSGI